MEISSFASVVLDFLFFFFWLRVKFGFSWSSGLGEKTMAHDLEARAADKKELRG